MLLVSAKKLYAIVLAMVLLATALGALALHGQTFGFRHEDVKCLRDVELYGGDNPATRNHYAALTSLAARIEALLPPIDAPTQQL